MNADQSPALAASNTVETLAAQVVESNIFTEVETAIENEAAKIEDKVDADVLALYEKLKAEEIAAKLEAEKIIAPVENLIEAAEAEVKKIYETVVHPEINQTRPVLNHTVGTSQIKNPA